MLLNKETSPNKFESIEQRWKKHRTFTLLSSGRGSGASSAPISTRQVEGRRPSPPEPPPEPPPLPPDISEPPLSVQTEERGERAARAAARLAPAAPPRALSVLRTCTLAPHRAPHDSPQRNADGIYLARAGGPNCGSTSGERSRDRSALDDVNTHRRRRRARHPASAP